MKISFLLISFILLGNFIKAQNAPKPSEYAEKMIESAPFIFEGEVINKVCYYDSIGFRIYTANIIQIDNILRADIVKGTIEVVTIGGIVGDQGMRASDALQLNEGNKGMFFCVPADYNPYGNNNNPYLYQLPSYYPSSGIETDNGISLKSYNGKYGYVKYLNTNSCMIGGVSFKSFKEFYEFLGKFKDIIIPQTSE